MNRSASRDLKLSVVIPCYRQAHYLGAALKSAETEDPPAKEVIVVDDGSPDDVPSVCASFGDRVCCIRQANAGVSAARNAGMDRAQGEYLLFLDADDTLEPPMLGRLCGALDEHPDWAMVCCGMRFLDTEGNPISRVRWFPEIRHFEFPSLVEANPVPPGAIIVRADALSRAGRFDPNLKGTEDWDLWLRIARLGLTCGVIQEILFNYRLHPAGQSKKPLEMYEMLCEVQRRGCKSDPRVSKPDPRWQNGVSPGGLEARYALTAAACLGKALGGEDAAVAVELLKLLRKHLSGAPFGSRHAEKLIWEWCAASLVLPVDFGKAWRRSWDLLCDVTCLVRADAELRALWSDVMFALSGHDRLQQSALLHQANYQRLAGAFPVRQMLSARRLLRGIPPPTGGVEE